MPYYLVKMDVEVADRSPLLPAAQLVRLVRHALLPFLEALADLAARGKVITGGYAEGERTMMFIVESGSEREVHELLKHLPQWNQERTTVERMHSIEELRGLDDDVGGTTLG
jgi:hypothetical protein